MTGTHSRGHGKKTVAGGARHDDMALNRTAKQDYKQTNGRCTWQLLWSPSATPPAATPANTHRELSRASIEPHVDGVFKVSRTQVPLVGASCPLP
ncbi:hypothetical protein E2C01_008840 [Portunus trituberculatus]|uniref:Uncharacterized protein n=1 Tax=Portunus trituberculatus TaxID=210409 RepID=A0A5B7D1V6_PORTR|nr:hypothetical protein [Portunus trituberculatus]